MGHRSLEIEPAHLGLNEVLRVTTEPIPDCAYINLGRIPRNPFQKESYFEALADQIDTLLEDGGVEAYCGSVRRLFSISNTVPGPEIIAEELNLTLGVGFDRKAAGYPLPSISVKEVGQWKDKLNLIVGSLLQVGLSWSNYWFNSRNGDDRLDLGDFDEEALYLVNKIVTFNYRFNLDSNNDCTDGEKIIHLVMASMNRGLLRFVRDKCTHTAEALYGDFESSNTEADFDFEAMITDLEDYDFMPEPDRFYFNTAIAPSAQFDYDDEISIDKKPDITIFKDLPLRTFFGLIQQLPLADQYFLLSRFGYINQGLNLDEICAKVGIGAGSRSVNALNNLYNLALTLDGYTDPQAQGSLPEMIEKTGDTETIKWQERERFAPHSAVHRLLVALKDKPETEITDNLHPDNYRLLELVVANLARNKNGTISKDTGPIRQAIEAEYGYREVDITKLRKIVDEYLIPQLNGQARASWRELFKQRQSLYNHDEAYELIHKQPQAVIDEWFQGLLSNRKNLRSEDYIQVVCNRFELDGAVAKTLAELARDLGSTRQRISQIEILAVNKLREILEKGIAPMKPTGPDLRDNGNLRRTLSSERPLSWVPGAMAD